MKGLHHWLKGLWPSVRLMCKQHSGLRYRGPSASAPRLVNPAVTPLVQKMPCASWPQDITFAGSLMQLPWPPTSFSQPYPWSSPQIIWKTSPLEDSRRPSRTLPSKVTIVRQHQVPSGGQSFYVGRCCCQKLGVLSGNVHCIEIPICKSHVNLLNFSGKEALCMMKYA